ncbi:hypothetical protein EV356DRAFT_571755 [Viridothelium virens]|uniref:Uncharacterized protein n=1 Tax=Viridothelium virens TaxID=1048519 RepID=A0A6A6GTH3_VIRVR|nr:hypothetical protein EV356DRAFT_571755 [Viridothelium virens]
MDLPREGLALSGAPDESLNGPAPKEKARDLLLVTIPSELRDAVREGSQNGTPAEFLAGKVPAIRINGNTHKVLCSTEKHRHELYHFQDSESASNGMAYAGTVGHTGRIAELQKVATAAAGAEAAEEQLKRSLQRLEQEKESRKANIMNTVTAAPGKKNKPGKLLNVLQPNLGRKFTQSMPNSPSFPGRSSSPMPGSGVTSAPNVQQQPEQLRALRHTVIHFLAMRPAAELVIARKTASRKEEVDPILLKVAKPTANSSEWQLLDKSYKELDVWAFPYPSDGHRQSAIDHAIRAYDRQRLAQSDPLWQMLLPKQERGKGKILSRLAAHLGPKTNINSTPRLGPKAANVSHVDGATDPSATEQSTARSGEAMARSTSQEGLKKKKISEREAQTKRLLSKNPKKAQAAFEAKQKKQQEKEVAKAEAKANRPTKTSTTTSATSKKARPAKSSEFVNESDEEEVELEIAAATSASKQSERNQLQSQSRKRPAEEDAIQVPKSSNSVKKAESENRPSDAKKRRIDGTQVAQKKPASNTKSESAASTKSGTAKSKTKALNIPTNGTSKSKSDISPRRSDTRPEVPSPLGASKPLTASYEPGRNSSQVTPESKSTKKVTAPSPLAQSQSSSSSKGQADRSGRATTAANHDIAKVNGRRSGEGTPSDTKRPRNTSAASSQATSSSDRLTSTPSSTTLKRKAVDSDKDSSTTTTQPPQRKAVKLETPSNSTRPERLASSSTATPVDASGSGSGTNTSDPLSASSDDFPHRLTPRQCRRLCEQMQTYYKTYETSRRKLEETPKTLRDPGEVADHWRMHNRLLEMKKMIWNADIPRSEGEPRSWGEYEERMGARGYGGEGDGRGSRFPFVKGEGDLG